MPKTTSQPDVPLADQAKPEKKMRKKVSLSLSPSLLSFVGSVLLLAYLIFGSWQAFQSPVAVSTPAVLATPVLPVMKLNQDNKRQAPAITVDENGIGKSNPFQ
jgi:hypothetical protein